MDTADDLLQAMLGEDHEIGELARAVLGDLRAQLRGWSLEPVDYAFGSPTTGGLFRIRGVAVSADRQLEWSLFVKLVHSYRHWPVFGQLPSEFQEEVLTWTTWRYEADLYASELGAALPPGLRLPRVHRIADLDGERFALLLEDVRTVTTPWTVSRFERAAHLLGRMAARLTRGDLLPASASRIPGWITRLFYTHRLLVAALPALADDATWTHPVVAATADPHLRADLAELARRVPAILNALEHLPQVLTHGDASPQNLLVPAEDPEGFVVIDWSPGGLAAVGDDLGQLLVGLAHAGELTAGALPELREVIVPAYTAGLAEEGNPVDEAEVRYGLDGGLVMRSAFTALPVERLDEPLTDELAELIAARVRLTRYLVDLGLALNPAAANR
ncbi:MAG: phosphotransferase [Pseudonocardiaceae bacterium]